MVRPKSAGKNSAPRPTRIASAKRASSTQGRPSSIVPPFTHGVPSASADGAGESGKIEATRDSGDDILEIARKHVGEKYVLGARAPMANASWKGPWDCAEFASWCLYQATGLLYGTEPRNDPVRADAYTGFWAVQAERDGATIALSDAAGIAGAFLLRKPGANGIGHIVVSDGVGGTVEAHSSAMGVVRGTVQGRRWDYGILVPGVRYARNERPIDVAGVVHTLRVTHPMMRGPVIRRLQEILAAMGFAPGGTDGVYGPQTAHAVRNFQTANGLVSDGEAGAETLGRLGLTVPE